MSDELTDEERAELEQVKAELLALPGVEAGLRSRLTDLSVDFITECVKAARRINALDDPMIAIRVMAESVVWAKEYNERLGHELKVRQQPSSTLEAFKR